MHKHYPFRPLLHPSHKLYQPFLIRMCRITAQGCHPGFDLIHLTLQVQHHKSLRTFTGLDHCARRALGLIADKQHLVARVAEHGLEVVDDTPTGTHATARYDNRRPAGTGQVVDGFDVLIMAINGDQLTKAQWTPTLLQTLARLFIPEVTQLAVGLGEAAGQRRVEYDRQLRPINR
ncbi:hypothetical protein D3C81_1248340 [compost metagenome]